MRLYQCVGWLGLTIALPCQAQTPLHDQLGTIAADAHGTLSVSCSLPGSALNCDLNPNGHPPMQSVFKLPLAIAVLHQVELGKLSLDQPVRFLPSDRYLPKWYSPLQDKFPQADVDVPLRELLRLAVSLSDNAAADLLLRISGGTAARRQRTITLPRSALLVFTWCTTSTRCTGMSPRSIRIGLNRRRPLRCCAGSPTGLR